MYTVKTRVKTNSKQIRRSFSYKRFNILFLNLQNQNKQISHKKKKIIIFFYCCFNMDAKKIKLDVEENIPSCFICGDCLNDEMYNVFKVSATGNLSFNEMLEETLGFKVSSTRFSNYITYRLPMVF